MEELNGQRWQDESAQVVAAFERDGYVALRGFLSAAEVTETQNLVTDFIQDRVPELPREQVFYEELGQPDTLKQIQQLFTHHSYFNDLMFGSKFEALAELLLNGPVVGKNMQYFNKPPQIGKATPPHQDGYYFMLKPCEAVTMWLALDKVDEENGCVRYVRGSHLRGMRPHGRTKTLGFSQGVTDYGTATDQADEVAFPAQPGDLLVHNAMTIHRADGNLSSTRTRRALGFIYYSERAKVDEEAHAAYQKRLAEEMKEAGKI
ncbi:phytanoyl-CoA dioxygenase family protein [Chloroflexi bacterium TSY]|nr:phytanoyl-CoA dioxygenase family protein [Chloroflexi bacterium TSY]